MARIAVLHNTLDFQGGADAVCLAVCEALAAAHEVTLFTISETALESVAARFERDVSAVTVRMPPAGRHLARGLSGVAPWTGPQLAFRSVLLQRYFRRHEAGFDLAVSTANEFALGIPSLQYVHFPQFNLHRTTEGDPGRLNGLWSRLAAPQTGKDSTGNPPASFQQTTVLTNSQWTGEVFEAIYGVQPTVLHPPVDPIECPQPWADRESGIVAIGRIAPDKRLLDAIEVVDRLRERGYDLHLHIAGSAPPAYRSYVSQVASAATERSHVHFERDVPRDRIRDLLCGHRFGLNLKEREHFGMAVAEYVAAGMLPFAPDGGGQREILQDRPAGLFDSVPDAVDRVAGAIDREDRPDLQRDRFASERFQATIRQQVSQTID